MINKIKSCTVFGLDCLPIDVEVDVTSSGLPSFNIVGLPDKAVEEARERVRSALKNSGFDFPQHHITINLAPADFPKAGAGFDLAIAVGILSASGQISINSNNHLFMGELSLDGSLRPVSGILSATLYAKENNYEQFFLPTINAKEAAIIPFGGIYPVGSLRELFDHFINIKVIAPYINDENNAEENFVYEYDLADIKGQDQAKRALEICAGGGHNLIFKGPPGSGKTLLARTLPSILPKMLFQESIEVTKIYSHFGMVNFDEPLITKRPFRAPHHTVSHIGLVGGGQNPRPGEISLSHRGVLFLDELSEFSRLTLEVLRQPLEDGFVTISRARGTIIFPSNFILVAATNPCPCGYYGFSGKHQCNCTAGQIVRYKKRISGPLLDRIDLYVEVPSVEVEKLTDGEYQSEKSESVRARVQKARNLQKKRMRGDGLVCNAEMKNKHLKKYSQLNGEALSILKNAVTVFGLSARSYQKIIKIGRTIADLTDSAEIKPEHIAEALQYRQKSEEY